MVTTTALLPRKNGKGTTKRRSIQTDVGARRNIFTTEAQQRETTVAPTERSQA